MADSDIDSFIRQQKAKLANERETLNNPGSNRRQWGAPVKLSPRGTLDTDALISDVQREKDRQEYLDQWKRQHDGQEPSPRGGIGGLLAPDLSPRLAMARPAPGPRRQQQAERDEYREVWRQQHPEARGFRPAASNTMALDTEKIIREVQQERQVDEDRLRGNNNKPMGGGSDNDEYRKIWERNHNQAAPPNKAAVAPGASSPTRGPPAAGRGNNKGVNIDALIAEASKERLEEEYRRLWEKRRAVEASQARQGHEVETEPQVKALPIGEQEEYRKKLREERHNEYVDHLKKPGNNRSQQARKDAAILIREDGRSAKLKQMEVERNKEYNEMLANKKVTEPK